MKEPRERFWLDEVPPVGGRWLGHGPAGDRPIEVCPSILSSPSHSPFGTAFSPSGDELLFAATHPDTEGAHIVWMQLLNGVWTAPRRAPFDSEWIDNDICMSPDGERVCWRSWRPLPGETQAQERSFLWMADRVGEGWSDASLVLCGGEPQYAGYPGIAADGTLYFAARRPPSECCVFRARRHGSAYAAPEPVVCGMDSGGDLTIAPDQSFLVIACWHRPDNSGESDLYVSFRRADDTWTELRNLDEPINNELNENCPMVSADGRRFFFLRYDPASKRAHTYCVSPSIIRSLRDETV